VPPRIVPRMDEKEQLHHYLRTEREQLLAKLDGLSEYDVRRPLTPTGTNLLGLVKHVASVQLGYFTDVFDRPSGRILAWDQEGADPDADMWAGADESREDILELHEFSAAQTDATIEALALDAAGEVPWWHPDRRAVTLHRILVHVCVETARHAGQADILREMLDSSAGNGAEDPNLPRRTAQEWADYRARLEAAAATFA
jgi:uncharacterized damage-inducible protein DinB